MRILRAWSEKPSPQFIAGAAAAVVVLHVSLWIALAIAQGTTLTEILSHWDSGHFSAIATDGYSDARWAFFPLYPIILKVFTWALNHVVTTPPQVAGTMASTAIFGLFVWVMASAVAGLHRPSDAPDHSMSPSTKAGWILFLLSPASYVFQSNHTESLFLLLTFGAFTCAFDRRGKSWRLAATLAGLAALTRNHGVLAAIVVAIISASRVRLSPASRLLRFSASGLISGALFALFPLYQFLKTGNPLLFVQAHENWNLPSGPGAYFATFWFGNPNQNTRPMSILHHVFVGLLILSCIMWWKRCRPVAAYVAFFVVLMPAQLEFVDAFRFGAVLWPVFFLFGDLVARRLSGRATLALIVAATSLNIAMTVAYGLGRWAY